VLQGATAVVKNGGNAMVDRSLRRSFAEDVVPMIASYRETLTEDRQELLDRFAVVDVARKVVGVGSVGTRCWVALLEGPDHREGDRLILQIKEAPASVLEPVLGRSKVANHGQRVVEGQRLMQAASDIMLGWIRVLAPDGVDRDFYVRQLWDGKGSAMVDAMEPDLMAEYGRLCGWTLAKTHARSGDAVAISAYLGGTDLFDGAIADFSEAYADLNERDYQAYLAAIAFCDAMIGRLIDAPARMKPARRGEGAPDQTACGPGNGRPGHLLGAGGRRRHEEPLRGLHRHRQGRERRPGAGRPVGFEVGLRVVNGHYPLWLGAEDEAGGDDRVAADVVERAAADIGHVADVLRIGVVIAEEALDGAERAELAALG